MFDDSDDTFQPLICPGCKHVYFARPPQLPTIGLRDYLCPDCYRAQTIQNLGLDHLFGPGSIFGW